MDYYKYSFKIQAGDPEILMALLSIFPFDTFQELEAGLEAYLPVNQHTLDIDSQVNELQNRIAFSFAKELIVSENWNKAWESNYHPITIGDYCGLRASFHQPITGVEHELVITPKMAFGTGHHETTHLMIQVMEQLSFRGEKVLDFGCGTGVLAILASKSGAARIDAVDNDIESYKSTLENCETNTVLNVNAYHGTLKDVPGKGYGIVLANINRNVILDSLPTLSNLTKSNGVLVVSGFVAADEEIMKNALLAAGFQLIETVRRNNWLAMQCSRH